MYEAYAFSGAMDEVTLVLFTTLAPSGAIAFILMSLPFIFKGQALDPDMQKGIDKYLSVPVLVAMIGLVASATHLGSPANALYVLSGFGRSPLSNEVVCGVVFLGTGGIYWLTSFASRPKNIKRRRVSLFFISLFGLCFIGAISLAYNADTIITWSNPLVIAALWLNALIGGPLLALFGFRLARFYTTSHRLGKAMLGLSIAALIANIIVYAIWGAGLPQVSNSMTSADNLVPLFIPMLVVFVALNVLGIALGAKAVANKGETSMWIPVVSVLSSFLGIFVMRFAFYMIHMTVGISI